MSASCNCLNRFIPPYPPPPPRPLCSTLSRITTCPHLPLPPPPLSLSLPSLHLALVWLRGQRRRGPVYTRGEETCPTTRHRLMSTQNFSKGCIIRLRRVSTCTQLGLSVNDLETSGKTQRSLPMEATDSGEAKGDVYRCLIENAIS